MVSLRALCFASSWRAFPGSQRPSRQNATPAPTCTRTQPHPNLRTHTLASTCRRSPTPSCDPTTPTYRYTRANLCIPAVPTASPYNAFHPTLLAVNLHDARLPNWRSTRVPLPTASLLPRHRCLAMPCTQSLTHRPARACYLRIRMCPKCCGMARWYGSGHGGRTWQSGFASTRGQNDTGRPCQLRSYTATVALLHVTLHSRQSS